MPRTQSTNLTKINRPDVEYAFTSNGTTVITIPPGSAWTSEPHWHLTHTEFLDIKSGTALVTLGSTTSSFTAASGRITVPRSVIHEWRRDPADDSVLVVEESTDPNDGQKELFFRNLSMAILDTVSARLNDQLLFRLLPTSWLITIQLFVIFRAYDNYPVTVSGPLGAWFTHVLLFLLDSTGRGLGFKARYPEYTP